MLLKRRNFRVEIKNILVFVICVLFSFRVESQWLEVDNTTISEFFVNAGESSTQYYHVSGTGFSMGQVVTLQVSDPVEPFTISTDQFGTYTSTIYLTADFGDIDQRIWVKYAPSDNVSHYVNIDHSAEGIETISIQLVGNPPPMGSQTLAFRSNTENGKIILDWEVASAKKISRFEIEMMDTPENGFQNIGIVDVEKSSNTTNNSFSFDYFPKSFIQSGYLRIKIVKESGDFSYSNIITFEIERSASSKLQVFPNPVSSSSKITFTSSQAGHLDVFILNMNGKKVVSSTYYLETGVNSFDLLMTNNLPAGLYTLISEFNGEINKVKIMKN